MKSFLNYIYAFKALLENQISYSCEYVIYLNAVLDHPNHNEFFRYTVYVILFTAIYQKKVHKYHNISRLIHAAQCLKTFSMT